MVTIVFFVLKNWSNEGKLKNMPATIEIEPIIFAALEYFVKWYKLLNNYRRKKCDNIKKGWWNIYSRVVFFIFHG